MEKDPRVAKIDSELIDDNPDLSEIDEDMMDVNPDLSEIDEDMMDENPDLSDTEGVMDENPRVAKADAEVQKLISQKRIKDSDDRKVSSEIFDKATLQVLYKLANQGHLDVLNG